MIYRVAGLVIRGEKVRMLGVITQIISGHSHLWFVPMIIGLYLMVPLLRLWVKEENVRSVEYFLLLSVVFAFVVPQGMEMLLYEFKQLKTIQTLVDNMHMRYPVGYTAFFVLGWHLNRRIRRKKLVCGLGIVGFGMTFMGIYAASVLMKMKTYPFYENFTINVLLYSAAIFVLCREWFEHAKKPDGLLERSVGWIGKYSLGIYAVHVCVISELMGVLGQMHAAAAMALIFVLTVVISGVVSMILHKIPLLKKVV